eukprot:786505_1
MSQLCKVIFCIVPKIINSFMNQSFSTFIIARNAAIHKTAAFKNPPSLEMDHFALNLQGKAQYYEINDLLLLILDNKQIKNQLVELDLSNNGLVGKIDWNLLSEFKQLKVICARNNFISSDMIPLESLGDIEQFDFSHNPYLSGNIGSEQLPKKLAILHVQHTNVNVEMNWDDIKETNLMSFSVSKRNADFFRKKIPENWMIQNAGKGWMILYKFMSRW